jgi:hypothetical protein
VVYFPQLTIRFIREPKLEFTQTNYKTDNYILAQLVEDILSPSVKLPRHAGELSDSWFDRIQAYQYSKSSQMYDQPAPRSANCWNAEGERSMSLYPQAPQRSTTPTVIVLPPHETFAVFPHAWLWLGFPSKQIVRLCLAGSCCYSTHRSSSPGRGSCQQQQPTRNLGFASRRSPCQQTGCLRNLVDN